MKMTTPTNSDRLNPSLIHKQRLSQEDVDALHEMHDLMDELVEKAHNTNSILELKQIAFDMEMLEFRMQDRWGLDKDKKFHTHWLRLPQCRCPKLDNLDPIYYGRGQIHSRECPIHGKK